MRHALVLAAAVVLVGAATTPAAAHPAPVRVTGDVLTYHYYADDGTSQLGVNLLALDSSGWPYAH